VHETTPAKTFRVVVLVVLTLFTIFPLYVMITSSMKSLADVQGAFTWWPTQLTLQPFIDMWTTVALASYFVNSLIVAGSATIVSLVIATFAAFAVSRFRFRSHRIHHDSVVYSDVPRRAVPAAAVPHLCQH
jgi:ABC-type sugar transport system, permease component